MGIDAPEWQSGHASGPPPATRSPPPPEKVTRAPAPRTTAAAAAKRGRTRRPAGVRRSQPGLESALATREDPGRLGRNGIVSAEVVVLKSPAEVVSVRHPRRSAAPSGEGKPVRAEAD